MDNSDSYKTIAFPSEEVLFKEKNSKFSGYAFPINSEEDVLELIKPLRNKHSKAGHFCFAFQIGVEPVYFRANDDGEPSNTAGMPIYGQIQSFGLTNVLVVVVRFFGGTKLGVGGLISAYRTTAQLTLENAEIIEKTIDVHFLISFEYKNINKVMRVLKEKNIEIVSQQMHLSCEIEIAIRKNNADKVYEIFKNMFEIEVKIKE